MNAVPWRERVKVACRIFLMSLAVVVGASFALPGEARAQAPSAAAESAHGGGLPANIPVKREQPGEASTGSSDSWWIVVVVAGGLLAFAVVAARRRARPVEAKGLWWGRFGRFFDAMPSREVQRVSSTPLSPRHSLHVVVWNGRRLLLGCTDQSIQLLAEAPAALDAEEPEPAEQESPR
jgi:hypothetical protein